MRILRVAFRLLAIKAASALYPDGHFENVKKIDQYNIDTVVEDAVNSGKTLFVRWVPQASCVPCQTQAVAWNEITKLFAEAENEDAIFGDAIMFDGEAFKDQSRRKQMRDGNVTHIWGVPQNPGVGGWPTIRFFNKQTGFGGQPVYDKEDFKPIHELLRETASLREIVEDLASTNLCEVSTRKGCNAKELKFLKTWTDKGIEPAYQELTRLATQSSHRPSPKMVAHQNHEVRRWEKQRIFLLQQLIPALRESNPAGEL